MYKYIYNNNNNNNNRNKRSVATEVCLTGFVSLGPYFVAQTGSGSAFLSLLSAAFEAPEGWGWLETVAVLKRWSFTWPPLCTSEVLGTALNSEGKRREAGAHATCRTWLASGMLKKSCSATWELCKVGKTPRGRSWMGKNLNKVLQKIAAELTDRGQLAYSSGSLESVKGIFFFFKSLVFSLSWCLWTHWTCKVGCSCSWLKEQRVISVSSDVWLSPNADVVDQDLRLSKVPTKPPCVLCCWEQPFIVSINTKTIVLLIVFWGGAG